MPFSLVSPPADTKTVTTHHGPLHSGLHTHLFPQWAVTFDGLHKGTPVRGFRASPSPTTHVHDDDWGDR
jgi:hypothetical protein